VSKYLAQKSKSCHPVGIISSQVSSCYSTLEYGVFADCVSSCCLDLFPILSHYCSSYCVVLLQLVLGLPFLRCPWWGVTTESLFVCGRGILPQCISDPLPIPQFDLHCHWFLWYMSPNFYTWEHRPEDIKNFPQESVDKFLHGVISFCWFVLVTPWHYIQENPEIFLTTTSKFTLCTLVM
jgi:hypothetical protein